MATVDELLAMATDCYAKSRALSNPLAKAALNVIGDDYRKQADELQRGRAVIQAVFPKPDRNCSMAIHGGKHHDNRKVSILAFSTARQGK
jgi:hypothetical protein